MLRVARPVVLAGALALGACAVAPPAGPTVMALPGKDKDFQAFQQDDMTCRQYAEQRIGYGSPAAAANQSAVNSAAIGTVLGAAAGAAIGAAAGNPAAGAAIGGGTGLLFGGASGANAANLSAGELQRAYDMGYLQCMSAKGENVPQSLPSYGYGYGYGYGYPYYPSYYYPYPPYFYGYGPSTFSVGFGFGHGFHGHHWH